MESRLVRAFQDDFEARGVRETENTTTVQDSHDVTILGKREQVLLGNMSGAHTTAKNSGSIDWKGA